MTRPTHQYSTAKQSDSFIHHAFWNLLAEAMPFAFALISIPMLISLIGKERFGLLSIVWMLVGYFNLFDLGLGRAIIYFSAKLIGDGKRHLVREVFWSGLWLMLALAMVVSIALSFLQDLIVDRLNINTELITESSNAIGWLVVAVPLVVLTTAFKGILQADQRFKTICAIQIPFGAYTFLVPVVVAWLGYHSVDILALSLVIGRAIFLFVYIIMSRVVAAEILHPSGSWKRLSEMLRYSGWIAVSNVIGPVMVYMDRALISAFLGLVAVTSYVVPFDLVYRTGIVPASIATVVFTSASFLQGAQTQDFQKVYNRAGILIVLLTVPVYAFMALFSHELLSFWVGADMASDSQMVMTIITLGLLVNAAARVPHATLQGKGHSNLTAISHLIELPAYIWALVYCIPRFGIEGAAWVWFARCFLDLLLLSAMCAYVSRNLSVSIVKTITFICVVVAIIFTVKLYAELPIRIAFVGLALTATLYTAGKLFVRPYVSWSR